MSVRVNPELNLPLADDFCIFGDHWVTLPCEVIDTFKLRGIEVANCRMDLSAYGGPSSIAAAVPVELLETVEV